MIGEAVVVSLMALDGYGLCRVVMALEGCLKDKAWGGRRPKQLKEWKREKK